MLSKGQILGAVDANVRVMNVQEWGGDVGLRVMSGTDFNRFFRQWHAVENPEGKLDIRDWALSRTLCDEAGNLLFSEEDVAKLGEKNSAVLNRLWNAVIEENLLGGKRIEEAEKNLESGPIESS